jgi:hypothetical protein
VIVHRKVSVKVMNHAYRNHVVSIVNVRRYMKRIEHFMRVMANT